MWLLQNNTFVCQCNLFAYRKYMPTHSPVCCQSPRMILMRNINGICPENMLVLVPITSQAMFAAILFNFCGRWLDQPITAISLDHWDLKSCFTNLTSLIQLTNQLWEYVANWLTFNSAQFNSLIAPKRRFFPVFRVFFQIPRLFPDREAFLFEFLVFPVPWELCVPYPPFVVWCHHHFTWFLYCKSNSDNGSSMSRKTPVESDLICFVPRGSR